MYIILTKASISQITVFHRCASIWGKLTSSPTCPNQLSPIGQTSIICTKLINAQVRCVTNVDSYSLYACTYVAGVRDTSKIICYHQVVFAAVIKLQQFEDKLGRIMDSTTGYTFTPCVGYFASPGIDTR